MKIRYILFLFLIATTIKSTAQYSSYDPLTGYEDSKTGKGLFHTDGSVQLGTFGTSSYMYLQTHSPHPMYFATNNSNQPIAVLALNGSFGIKLPLDVMPTEKLEMRNGRLRIFGDPLSAKPPGITFTEDAGTSNRAFWGLNQSNHLVYKSLITNKDEVVFKEAANDAFVGLGVTNPAYTLDIDGDIRVNSLAAAERSIILLNTNNIVSRSTVSPTTVVSPHSFTYSNLGSLLQLNNGFLPSSLKSTWNTLNAYYYVEKALSLPNGSTIKDFVAYLSDNDPNNNMRVCLRAVASNTGVGTSYCTISTTNSPNLLPYSLTTPVNLIIDNTQYTYVLRAESINNSAGSGLWTSSMGFGNIRLVMSY